MSLYPSRRRDYVKSKDLKPRPYRPTPHGDRIAVTVPATVSRR
jgi:hypothetical protein